MTVDTQIESLSVQPLKHTLVLNGLKVANPPDFEEGPAMLLEQVYVEVDPATLFSATPVIQRILVENGDVYLRYKPGTGTNLGCLAERASNRKENEAPAKWRIPWGRERRFIVGEFRCSGARITLSKNPLAKSWLNLQVAPFSVQLTEGDHFTSGDIGSVFVRSMVGEVLTLKGLLRPVAKRLKEELQGMTS